MVGIAVYVFVIEAPTVHESPLRYVGPHVACFGRVVLFDGKRYGTIERVNADAETIVALPNLDGVVRDGAQVSGERLLLLSRMQTSVALYAGGGSAFRHEYVGLHKETIEGAVLDAGRQRVVTIGADKKPRFPDDLYGPGTVSVCGFDGVGVGRPYRCNGPPCSIARDRLANTVVVGTTTGWVHVFECGHKGLQTLSSYRLKAKLYSVAISSQGEYVAATGRGIVAIWHRGDGEPFVEFDLGRDDDGGGVVCFDSDISKSNSAHAIVFCAKHVWSVTLSGTLAAQEEFDVDVYVQRACPLGRANEVVVIGMEDPSRELYQVYSLNVESKRMSPIPWENP